MRSAKETVRRVVMSPNDVEPQAAELWATEIDRRAREVADGKVVLVDADEVHAEAAKRLRARADR